MNGQTYEVWKKQNKLNSDLENYVFEGDIEGVKICIEEGADIHFNDEKPLLTAVKSGNLEMVKILTSKGADVNVSLLEPFYLAIKGNYLDIAKHLLEDCNLKWQNRFGWLVDVAKFYNNYGFIEYLFEQASLEMIEDYYKKVNTPGDEIVDGLYNKAMISKKIGSNEVENKRKVKI